MGEPQRVAAITPSWRNLAKPKSAIFNLISDGDGLGLSLSWHSKMFWKQKRENI